MLSVLKTTPRAFSRPIHRYTLRSIATMKALVYRGVQDFAIEDRPKPQLSAPTDAIVKLSKTTICGTDLHILQGDVPTVTPGRILGHEGLGTVESVGNSVTAFAPGDRVIISCISACGTCEYCRRGMPSHCASGGWALGNTLDGTQAEFVRIPHAAASLHPAPPRADPRALVMLSDVLPTALECGTLNGRVAPGARVAIVGAGPVGLAALLTAQLYAPATLIAVDRDAHRLAVARRLGATHTVHAGPAAAADVLRITRGRGVDTAIEAVGSAPAFAVCQEILAVGGTLANVGVHGAKADLHLEALWDRNVAITTRLVDATTTPLLIGLVESGRLAAGALATHTFRFAEIARAYAAFKAAAANDALKVIVDFD